MRLQRRCRLGAALVIATVGIVILTGRSPASATFDSNDVGCSGHAVITPKGGASFTVDATQAKATVPREAGPVDYEGAVSTITHDHAGAVKVLLGPFGVKIYDWKSANGSNAPSSKGTREYPAAIKKVPPGVYRVEGAHRGNEGGCTGHMDITVEGSPLSSPAGAGSLIALLLALAGVVASGRAKAGGRWNGHPILGGVSGLFLGALASIAAIFFKVSPLTTPLLAILVVAGLLLGLGWSAVAPIGRGRAADARADG
jgi:hypothetical protein